MKTSKLTPLLAIALLVFSGAALAEHHAKPEAKADTAVPTLGGSAESDLTCEAMPGEAAGHFVCEDPDSYKRCKEIEEAKGKVRLEGAKEDTPVLMCMQGG